MALTLIRDGKTITPIHTLEKELEIFCSKLSFPVTFEWNQGQWDLHSDLPRERPISLRLDEELERHETYFKKNSLHKELLARAIGIKGSFRPSVVDLTAGLLGDSLLFLAFGCSVVALERNPVVAFLIQSALNNSQHPALQRFSFTPCSAQEFLDQKTGEVFYFDPMFEDENEKAAPRKEMRIFRTLIGQDEDAQKVLELALAKNPKRLVVKRPRLSRVLGEKTPLQYVGKSTRYDVYLKV